ncbi:MAG: GNAT family protein [Christensenella sp.]|nr:GNAT family protein [Christensenella sp.]
MPIPFETERCRIRPFEENDIETFMSYRNNLDWMQFQGFKGKKYLEYKAALLKQPNFHDGVQLAVVHRQTGELLGDLYLKLEKNIAWIGYTIAPQFARQGYAFEVVTQLLLQLKQAGLTLVKAGVEAQNLASIQLLKKLDFTLIGNEDNELIYEREL